MDLLKLYNMTLSGPWISKDDTEYKFVHDSNGVYLVFPPTGTLNDWKQNFDFLQVPYKYMPVSWKAHRGFLGKYKTVREDILTYIMRNSIVDLTIVGFSQGASLATLAHEDISYNVPLMIVHSYVFGSPRVVSWNAPKDRWNNLYRITNGSDIVTGVPLVIMGFKHVGVEEKIGNKGLLPSVSDHATYAKYL